MSSHYQKLDSEKYFTTSLLSDHKASRRRARQAFKDCVFNCMMVVLACVAAFFAIKTMPTWLPVAESTFHQLTNYRFI